MGARQIYCKSEADPRLAADAAAASAAGEDAIVFGRDTDYCFFRGCAYLEFGSLRILPENIATGKVISRNLISKTLGIPEVALVEWACYAGNDYTKPFVQSAETNPFSLVRISDEITEMANDAQSADAHRSNVQNSTHHRCVAQQIVQATICFNIRALQKQMAAVRKRTETVASRFFVKKDTDGAELDPPGKEDENGAGNDSSCALCHLNDTLKVSSIETISPGRPRSSEIPLISDDVVSLKPSAGESRPESYLHELPLVSEVSDGIISNIAVQEPPQNFKDPVLVLSLDTLRQPASSFKEVLDHAVVAVDNRIDWKKKKRQRDAPFGGWCQVTIGEDALSSIQIPSATSNYLQKQLLFNTIVLSKVTGTPLDEVRKNLRAHCRTGGRDPKGSRIYMLSRSQILGVEGSKIEGDSRARRELAVAEASIVHIALSQAGLGTTHETLPAPFPDKPVIVEADAILRDSQNDANSQEDHHSICFHASDDEDANFESQLSTPKAFRLTRNLRSLQKFTKKLCTLLDTKTNVSDNDSDEDSEDDRDGGDILVSTEIPSFLVNRSVQFVLHCSNPSSQRAVDFSRAQYNLEDTTPFVKGLLSNENEESTMDMCGSGDGGGGDDASSVDGSGCEGCEGSNAYDVLSEANGEAVCDMVSHEEVKYNHDIKVINRAISSNLSIAEAIVNDSKYANMCTDTAQRDALLDCIHGTRVAFSPSQLSWDDANCCLKFQKVCVHLLRTYRLRRTTQKTLADYRDEDEPAKIFHGPTFHSLAQKFRQDTAPAALANTIPSKVTSTPHATTIDGVSALSLDLPIDAYESQIIDHVSANQVTVIVAETGAGKSTRVPEMLLNSCETSGRKPRIYVSQPRRVAATAIRNRLATKVGTTRVGLRLGGGLHHGDRTAGIQVCTAGWLQVFLAHNLNSFRCTHLIIDEVHERSVDTDLLCYYARELLRAHPDLKLILMSATVSADAYCRYFGLANVSPLFVGARRFPLTIRYLEDIDSTVCGKDLPPPLIGPLSKLKRAKWNLGNVPTNLESHYAAAAELAWWVSEEGRSVLIFVAGRADIEELMHRFDTMHGIAVVVIHGELDLDEQMHALETANPKLRRIVIATNAAESSLTVPDCDNVICLGIRKSMQYNKVAHQQQLGTTWISQASAAQRAGRTGRVGPGTVWRLYPQKAIFSSMHTYDPPDMLQSPIDSVMLQLMVGGGVNPAVDILSHVLVSHTISS